MLTGNSIRFNFCPFLVAVSFLLLFASCSLKKNIASNKTDPGSGKEKIKTDVSAPAKHEPTRKKQLQFYQDKYAPMLGSTNQLSNIELYQFMDQWMKTPFKYGGNSKAGIDCSRLSIMLLDQVYHKNISGSSADIYIQSIPIAVESLKEGDLVFFKINGTVVNHMGVYLVNNKFIHATTKAGVLVSDLNEAYYRKYFFSAGRIK